MRVDYDLNPNYRLTGRYTHDNSFTEEPGGLFLGLAVPNVATTDTNVPGQVAAAVLRSASSARRSSTSCSSSSRATRFRDANPSGTNEPAVVARPDAARVCSRATTSASCRSSTVTGRCRQSAPTSCSTSSTATTRSPTTSPGSAARTAFKVGGLVTFEQKNENAANADAGQLRVRPPAAAARRSTISSPATPTALCGNACTYSEAQNDVTEHLRFNRYEFYAQDTLEAAQQRHGRLRRPLLALSADHRRQQRPDQLPAVALRRRERAEAAPTRRAR